MFLDPQALSRLAATFEEKSGVLSVQPHHHMEKPHEQMSLVFNIIQTLSSNAFTLWGDRIREKREGVSVFIDPEKIIPEPSAEAMAAATDIKGRVVQMIEENGKVRIVVDAGVWIALLIPKEHYRKIGFLVGETIDLAIPLEAITVM